MACFFMRKIASYIVSIKISCIVSGNALIFSPKFNFKHHFEMAGS